MNLEELNHKKMNLLGQISTYEGLQLGLEHIKRYNRENYSNEKLKVYTNSYEPHHEEITVSNVADILEQLNNNLLDISNKINQMKIAAK
jgi:spore germination protein YaaH